MHKPGEECRNYFFGETPPFFEEKKITMKIMDGSKISMIVREGIKGKNENC